MRQEINTAIQTALNHALQNLQIPAGQRGQQGPAGPAGPPGEAATGTGSERWNPSDLGYFDPHLDKSFGEGEIVTVGKDTYFRNVILFTERIRDVATVKSATLVKTHLNTALRGTALMWYTTELSELEKLGLRAGDDVEQWCKTLTKRFKESTGVALNHLTAEKYSVADARNKREPAGYVQSVIRHAKAANIDNVENQLTFAHQGIAAELRAFVDAPSETTTVASFIQVLELKKDTWFEMSARPFHQRLQQTQQPQQQNRSFLQGLRQGQQQQYANRQGQQNYGNQPYNSNSSQFYPRQPSGYQFRPSGGQFAYNNQQYGYQPNQQYGQQNRPVAGPSRLQITAPSTSGSTSSNQSKPPNPPAQNGRFQRRDDRGYQGKGKQPWRPQSGYRNQAAAYQTDHDTDDRPMDHDAEDQSDQHDPHEAYQGEPSEHSEPSEHHEESYPDGDDAFWDGQHDEAFANFVGIQTVCRNCNESFTSKSKLHKHLRQGCQQKASVDLPKPTAKTCPDLPKATATPQLKLFASDEKSRKAFASDETSRKAHDESSREASCNHASFEIIDSKSTEKSNVGTGFAFRGWNYARILIRLLLDAIDEQTCIDSGCGVTLADKLWLLALLPQVEIRRMASPLRVKGLGSAMHDTDEYVLVPIYIPATKDDGTEVLCRIMREIHLVDNLKANMLIGNDVIGPEQIVIDVSKGKAIIGSCGATANITSRQRGPYQRRAIHAKKALIVAPRANIMVPVATPETLPERDFIFEPLPQRNLTLYAHLVDSHIAGILVKNETDQAVQIPKRLRLGMLCEVDYENVFFTEQAEAPSSDALPKASMKPSVTTTNWIKKAATLATVASMSIAGSLSQLVNNATTSHSSQSTDVAKETKLPNGVMVYGNNNDTQLLTNLVNEFPTLWKDEGFAKVPENDWMKLTLRDDWQSRLPKSNRAKVYPLGIDDRAVVDKTFDDLHRQGRLEYTSQATPFSYPVFVVWKTLPDGTRKGRAVVDIRGLNDLIVPDVYPVPLQSDIIARLLGCTHLSILDAMSFFYQWLVHRRHRYMLTVVSHRGQETFNVPIMGCMNSIAYVQRQIDKILRPIKEFAQAYIDDIVLGSKSLAQHVAHLRRLFQLLVDHNIAIAATKTFLNYPNINLLGRKVDSFGMATATDKLKAISEISYPSTLGDLEHYLGLTGYLRSSVHFYAQLASPLQALKTRLLKDAPSKGNPRRSYSSKLRLPQASKQEAESFRSLQEALSKPSLLVHFDPNRPLWIDLDASREWGFGVQIFHVKQENANMYKAPADLSSKPSMKSATATKWPARTAIEPIMYLSRMLTSAERNYWPTELEIAGFVWTIKKVRHLVESSKLPVVIQTDHSAILDIMKQSSITSTTSTLRMNVRLVRASQFLRQFRLDVRHKPGKEHIVPDALSRLASATSPTLPDDHSELDVLYACATQAINYGSVYNYSATMVEMDEAFHKSLVEGYQKDPHWKRIGDMIDENAKLVADGEGARLPFVRGTAAAGNADLIFHRNKDTGLERLCIPQGSVKQVLEIAHGNGHPGFERTVDTVAKSWYIRHLSKHIHDYIKHCPECLVLQTRRHRPYGYLQPIESPSIPFHTLSLDFILAMPLTDDGLDCALTVTDKFTKRTTYIPGKATWTAEQWAIALLDRLDIGDWGIPKVLLSDRDPKFLSDLWKSLFDRMGVSLLYSTAYHPQTDGSSERTNQTAEIALRFYLHGLQKASMWPFVLPRLQALLNNAQSTTTGKSPNELAYGFRPNRPLDLASSSELPQQVFATARIEAADAISFAQMSQKFYYDRRHQPMYFKRGEKVLLRLHKGYSIPQPANATKTDKLGQRYVGPFEVIAKVGKQAYRLDIPGHWRVHPVFTVAQLEPWPDGDPYQRPLPDKPDSVHVEGDTAEYKSYEIESLLNKRVRTRGLGQSIEYLIRWKGYGPEFDQWYNVKHLGDAAELVQDYEDSIAITATEPFGPLPQPSPPLLPQRPSWDMLDTVDPPPLPKPSQKGAKAIMPPKLSATEHAVAVAIPPSRQLPKPSELSANGHSATLSAKAIMPPSPKPSGNAEAIAVVIPPKRLPKPSEPLAEHPQEPSKAIMPLSPKASKPSAIGQNASTSTTEHAVAVVIPNRKELTM